MAPVHRPAAAGGDELASGRAGTMPSRRELLREFARYTPCSTPRGLALFVFDLALYGAAIAGVLFLPALWMKIAVGAFAGLCLGRLFSLAHHAAHDGVVRGHRLNQLIALVSFTTFFYSYRLWVYEHHRLHHPSNNDTKPDAYTPFSKAAFDALPRWRQWLERFYRAPTGIGWGVYYLLERHWWTKLYPPAYVPPAERRAAWWNTALLGAYAIALFTFLVASPAHATNLTPFRAILLGFVLPQSIFETLDGFALYAQHTDPRIPWFKEEPDREAEGRTELLSVHLIVPRPMGWFFHDTFSHPVHHLLPKIPCYRTHAAQCALDRRLGPAAVTSRLGPRWFFDTMRRCKLYDWDNHRWLDFDGHPTTAPIAAARPGSMRGAEAATSSGAPASG